MRRRTEEERTAFDEDHREMDRAHRRRKVKVLAITVAITIALHALAAALGGP